MTPRLLIFAILAGILLSQPVYRHAPRWTEDPIAPPGHDGALILHELTIEESAQQAGLVVVGRVVSQTSRDTAGSIETDVTLDVERVLKGSTGSPSNVVTFTIGGGQVGSRRLFVGGMPNFVFGERVLVFLRSAADRRLLQLHTSKYTLAGSTAIQQDGRSSTSLPIPDVENRMRGVLGPTVAIGTTANASPQPFTIRSDCPAWEPSQYPIRHRINDGTQGTPGAGPGPGAPTGFPHYDILYRALLLWQAQPGFYSAFNILGATAADGKNHNDGENTVAWRNLQTDNDGGEFVIGLNYCVSSGGLRTESDTLLTNSSPGNCGAFPNSCFWTWDSDPDDGMAGNALSTRVVAGHEFGHEVDLNHSDQCTGSPTPIMCATIQAGIDKVLHVDDINGATSLYPLSGAAPGAPSALSATATSSTSNTLNWTASSGGAFAYDIERATGSCAATFRSINSVPVGQTTYLDNNYGTLLPVNSTYCYRVKALGQGGDSAYSNTATTGAQCPVTATALWPPSVTPGTPALQDFSSHELGVKFRADVTGTVCGMKFYKGPGNTGTHTGRLWSASGTLLASATFSNETATGWQNVAFSNPVQIAANTTYVVSYTDPSGRESYDANYFANQYDNGVLHAPASASVNGNGVAGSPGAFPTSPAANSGNFWVDVLFVPDATPSSCTGTTRTTFAQAAQPQTPDFPDSTPLTLGAKFRADVPGIVCAVRFYKGIGNVGTHTGQLWTANGTLLGQVTFTGESGTGWQQANFAQPIQISANTTYVISYTAPNGHFSYSQGQLANGGVDNPPLHILSNSAGGGNGVAGLGVNTFPNTVSSGNNFWVDLVFQANAGLCGTSTMSVFSPASTPATPAYPDTGNYEIGVKFVSDVAGQVCGVRFYKGSGNGGTHTGRLWDANGVQLASAVFTNETATGWQQVLFSNPVQIVANTTYIVSYSDPVGRFSFNQGQLNASIDSPPLHLPANGPSGGNAVVAVGVGNFPNLVSAGNNFWVDLVFAPGSSSGGLSDSCTSGSSSVFLSTSTPGTASYPDPNAYEFGMRFRPDVNGTACGVRFYKGSGNVSQHTGRLWTNGGVLLASVVFTGETSSGWQQALFSNPVALQAGVTYVVSYTDPFGNFSFDAGTFNNSVNNGVLHAPSTGTGGGSLVGVQGTFPTASSSNNFWVDILFAPTCPCSVWSSAYTPTTQAHPDPNNYELGMRIKPDQNGFITGVRFYKGATNNLQHAGRLWRADGALLAQAIFTNESASGWQQVDFSTPVFVGAGTTYVVSYGDPGGHFAHDANYFRQAIESGPFTVFANANGGNAVYNSLGLFPSQSANSANFWVDAVWVASCLSCLTVQPASVAPAIVQIGQPPPAPGTAIPAPRQPAGSAPPGSQQIRPPTGDSIPPIPSASPPRSTRGRAGVAKLAPLRRRSGCPVYWGAMTKCSSCGSSSWQELPLLPQAMLSDGRTVAAPLARSACRQCGLVRHTKPLTSEGLQRIFAEDYGLYAHTPGAGFERERQRVYASWLLDLIGDTRVTSLFEVGCGNGSLLAELRRERPGWRLAGLEPAPDAVAQAQAAGLDVRVGYVGTEDLPYIADVAVAINTLEHVEDPVEFLRLMGACLTPNGRLLIVCPDGDRPSAELLIYDHVHSFSRLALHRLARQAGLCVQRHEPSPEALGPFQGVVLSRETVAGTPEPQVPSSLMEDRQHFLQAWRDLDTALLARCPSGMALEAFGAGETAGLLRTYAPGVWSRVTSVTLDEGCGEYAGLPVHDYAVHKPDPSRAVLLAVRQAVQPMLAAKLEQAGNVVLRWDDLVGGKS